MELNDCAFPTLNRVIATDDAKVAFRDCQVAMLVGARPRGPGMERKDLLLANAQIFSAQGKALNEARRPRGARCWWSAIPPTPTRSSRAPTRRDLNPRNFTAMTRLDHNRALSQLAEKTGAHVTRHPPHDDLGQPLRHAVPGPDGTRSCTARARPRWSSAKWIEQTFIPTVQQRGAAVIKARGASSAASAASAAIDHVHTWLHGTADGRLGEHGGARRRQLRHRGGRHLLLSGHGRETASTRSSRASPIDEFSRKRMDATHAELREERDGVKSLLG